MIVIFYENFQFHQQNCDNATMHQYSFSNNYHVKFSSDGWSEHLYSGIVNPFDAREIYLTAWVEHTKTSKKLSLLRFFPTIGDDDDDDDELFLWYG